MCHSGVGLTPTINGVLHHFSAGGLFNGLVLLIDDESLTYWDHVTGEAVHGPLLGTKLEVFPISMTTVAALLAREPTARGAVSKPPLRGRLFSWLNRDPLRRKGFLPPRFDKTMGVSDGRLDPMTPGLGVVVDEIRRFYPMSRLPVTDVIAGRQISVTIGDVDRTPRAEFADGAQPFQLMTRWYGFAFTYPECDIGPHIPGGPA